MLIIDMQKEYLKSLIIKTWVVILILYGQGDKLLLAYVFENRTNKFIEIYEPDLPQFLSAPELASQACLKKG